MGRKHFHPSTCRVCGKTQSDGETISQTGLCQGCGERRLLANHRAMKTMTGPFARHWRERVAASVGASLDDKRPAA